LVDESINLFDDRGVVYAAADGVATIHGLNNCFYGEEILLENSSGGADVRGVVLNLERDNVKVCVFGSDTSVYSGSVASRTFDFVSIDFNFNTLGHVIDPLGIKIDMFNTEEIISEDIIIRCYVDSKAPGIISRESICEPLQTGIIAIDSMIPIGRGQRELIIGDRGTGKTTIAVDTIINARADNNDLFCIYVAIGQKLTTVRHLVDKLVSFDAMAYSLIVNSTAGIAATLCYLAPYAACSIGELFRDNGCHALIVYDDLSKHAVAYRQISLLLRRPPGREAYPGDIFYLHARLLERAAKMNKNLGGGSLTALPIIETLGNDITAYIPTNVISITDGQIYLKMDLFYKGIIPAIDIGLSVSRVGSAALIKIMRRLAGNLKLTLALHKDVEVFAAFGDDVDISTRRLITRGARLVELMKQKAHSPLPITTQVIIIFMGVQGYFDDISINLISKFKDFIVNILAKSQVAIFNNLKEVILNTEGIYTVKMQDNELHLFAQHVKLYFNKSIITLL
jgi:proton translocating ATP synthase F1 alpha subunit